MSSALEAINVKSKLTTEGDVAVVPSDLRVHRVAPRTVRTVVRVATVVLGGGRGSIGEVRVTHARVGHLRAAGAPRLAGCAVLGYTH